MSDLPYSSPIKSNTAEAESVNSATVTEVDEYPSPAFPGDIVEIKRLYFTRTAIQSDFEKIATEIQKLDEGKAFPKLLHKDWLDKFHKVFQPFHRCQRLTEIDVFRDI